MEFDEAGPLSFLFTSTKIGIFFDLFWDWVTPREDGRSNNIASPPHHYHQLPQQQDPAPATSYLTRMPSPSPAPLPLLGPLCEGTLYTRMEGTFPETPSPGSQRNVEKAEQMMVEERPGKYLIRPLGQLPFPLQPCDRDTCHMKPCESDEE